METIAGLELEGVLVGILGLLLGTVGFFLARFFGTSDKMEERNSSHVTHIALIHEKIGTHAASKQKQWAAIDHLMRDVAELKIKVAVLERERDQ